MAYGLAHLTGRSFGRCSVGFFGAWVAFRALAILLKLSVFVL